MSLLTWEVAREIKRLLWNGERQLTIGLTFGVSQSYVSRIVSGHIHADVPWPSGEEGALPQARKWALHAERVRRGYEESFLPQKEGVR